MKASRERTQKNLDFLSEDKKKRKKKGSAHHTSLSVQVVIHALLFTARRRRCFHFLPHKNGVFATDGGKVGMCEEPAMTGVL